MNRPSIRRALCAAAAVPLIVLAGCGGSSNGSTNDEQGPAGTACGALPSADPAATLPAGFPVLADQVLYDPKTQGATTIVFARLDESDFVEVRDELVDKLKAAGYTIDGTDQEAVEAEAQFSGKQTGTIKVQPLCKGKVSIRYKVE
ncbi:MAG: hypothetical protein LC789_07005 [Actinobacteria bacterium]|nr:hypothetical protein [Actinomycetota bacterium]MCA1721788.1 hypothetical protein [Actinomycetota bacterium]